MSEFIVPENKAVYEQLTKDAEPLVKEFWTRFLHLIEVPRPSFHHGPVEAHIESIAKECNWKYTKDESNNIIIYVPATPGMENAPTVCLQGHTDIVGVSDPGYEHNKEQDPLRARIEGDYLYATHTSLGGDDGAGVCTALALAKCGSAHGPLELLFTSDEEVGLIGASALKPNVLKARYLINIDSEDEGVITIGCAGGQCVQTTFEVKRASNPFKDAARISLRVTGLRGGHTGVEIHDGRLSGIQAMGTIGMAISEAGIRFVCGVVTGGTAHNAICSDITAKISVERSDLARLKEIAQKTADELFMIYKETDPDAKLEMEEFEACGKCCLGGPMTEEDTLRIFRYMAVAPFGVFRMSKKMPGVVETSCATTRITMEENKIIFLASTRSSYNEANHHYYLRLKAMAQAFGAQISEPLQPYPSWPPNPETVLLKVAKQAYLDVAGKEAKVEAIHAGLECGVVCAVHEGLQSISIGPDVLDVHSTREHLGIQSTQRTLKYMDALLAALRE